MFGGGTELELLLLGSDILSSRSSKGDLRFLNNLKESKEWRFSPKFSQKVCRNNRLIRNKITTKWRLAISFEIDLDLALLSSFEHSFKSAQFNLSGVTALHNFCKLQATSL